MLKKVSLLDTATGKTISMIVDSDDDEMAVLGAGKAPNEVATVTSIWGGPDF